jgi:transcriptional regulator of aromatic amino acid metabolism
MDHTKSPNGIVGDAATVPAMIEMILKVAPRYFTVLIRCELATGNDLIASSIQRNSNRLKAPFLGINCWATPETLMEAHLFGHQQGKNPSRSDQPDAMVFAAGHAPQLRTKSRPLTPETGVISAINLSQSRINDRWR